eukprot:3812466-Pleurochrysis_carterae.AAC.1
MLEIGLSASIWQKPVATCSVWPSRVCAGAGVSPPAPTLLQVRRQAAADAAADEASVRDAQREAAREA